MVSAAHTRGQRTAGTGLVSLRRTRSDSSALQRGQTLHPISSKWRSLRPLLARRQIADFTARRRPLVAGRIGSGRAFRRKVFPCRWVDIPPAASLRTAVRRCYAGDLGIGSQSETRRAHQILRPCPFDRRTHGRVAVAELHAVATFRARRSHFTRSGRELAASKIACPHPWDPDGSALEQSRPCRERCAVEPKNLPCGLSAT